MSEAANDDLPLGTIYEIVHGGELRRMAVCEFKGHRFVDVRHFFLKEGDWKHGRDGARLPVTCLYDLHAALGNYLNIGTRAA